MKKMSFEQNLLVLAERLDVDASFFDFRLQDFPLDSRETIAGNLDNILGERKNVRVASASSPVHPKKILFVCGLFPSIRHGGGLRIFDQLLEIKRRGVDVYVFAKFENGADGGSYQVLLNEGINVGITSHQYFDAVNLRVWLRTFDLHADDFDVIQLEFPDSLKFAPCAAEFAKRSGYTLMECVSRRLFMELNETVNSKTKRMNIFAEFLNQSSIEADAYRYCDFCVTVTQQDADFATRLFSPDNLSIVAPTWLSPSQFQTDVHATPTADLLFLGSFHHRPNVDGLQWYLQRVHPLVLQSRPETTFRIVGGGPVLDAITEPRPRGLEILGWVENLQSTIQSGRVCIAPIISGAGIRGKVIQYAASERPTVSTALGAEGLEILLPSGGLCIEDEPEKFAAAISNFLDHEDDREESGRKVARVVQSEFSLQKIITSLFEVYSALLERSGRA